MTISPAIRQREHDGPADDLVERVFCPQCGVVRIRNGRSPYAVCPNGHGKLVRRFTKAEARKAIADVLPVAHRTGRNRFAIEGYEGLFCYRNGSGRRRVEPGSDVGPDEVIAQHVTPTRRLVRVFARKPDTRRKDSDG